MFKERNRQIVRDYKSGLTLRQVGEKWSLSYERVRQILHLRGVRPRTVSEASNLSWALGRRNTAKGRVNEAARARQREAAALRESGLSYSQVAEKLGVTRNTVAGLLFRHSSHEHRP